MPWNSVEEAEKSVPAIKKYSARGKRAFLHAFNSCYKDKGDSESCYKIAHYAAKNASKSACIMCGDSENEMDDVEVAEELVDVAKMILSE